MMPASDTVRKVVRRGRPTTRPTKQPPSWPDPGSGVTTKNATPNAASLRIHLWWARRPLAACRAMLLALLLPDPCDPLCPKEFKEKARALLPKVQGKPGPKDIDLRKALLKFIGDFSNWDLSSN